MPQNDKISEIDDHIMKRFDIKKRIGKGAYGIVWKAVDRKTKDVVAIKKIFDAFRNQTDAQRTFREIMFLQSFKNHPNIVRLHSIHRAANNRDIYLGFEYMETDLHNVIKRGNILRDIHKRYIMYQLLKATKYIHSGNVIHRDQKPSNILLDSLCRCKIADFGLARSLTQSPESSPTDSDPILTDYVATRWYRAPEILIANRRYTKGIDMWSLGCILGEMLAGKPLFPGTSTVNQVEKIMATIPPPTSDDIASVCSGIGSSMIQTGGSCKKVPLTDILGNDSPSDAIDLVNKLLVFNPSKRLNAEQALEHRFVEKFRNKEEEIVLNISIVPPLNDDVRLSVDDYRNKLYELMSGHNHRPFRLGGTKQSMIKQITKKLEAKPKTYTSQINGNASRDNIREIIHHGRGELHSRESLYNSRDSLYNIHKDRDRESMYDRHPKNGYLHRERVKNIHSEPKIQNVELKQKMPSTATKSDSKIPVRKIDLFPSEIRPHRITANHESKIHPTGNIGCNDKTVKKRSLNSLTSSLYVTPGFNSYNQSHGIITASALMELRSGIR